MKRLLMLLLCFGCRKPADVGAEWRAAFGPVPPTTIVLGGDDYFEPESKTYTTFVDQVDTGTAIRLGFIRMPGHRIIPGPPWVRLAIEEFDVYLADGDRRIISLVEGRGEDCVAENGWRRMMVIGREDAGGLVFDPGTGFLSGHIVAGTHQSGADLCLIQSSPGRALVRIVYKEIP